MKINERFIKTFQSLGIKRGTAWELFNIDRSYLSKIENGKKELRTTTLAEFKKRAIKNLTNAIIQIQKM